MPTQEFTTDDGLSKLKQQLIDLEQKLIELRLHKGTEAVFAGDMWHDNPTFREVESQERTLMRSIAEMRQRIKGAQIIALPKNTTAVGIGTEVEVRFSDGTTESFKILGQADSDPTNGILSYKSPLARAILGRQIGDKTSYTVNGYTEKVEIIGIFAISNRNELPTQD